MLQVEAEVPHSTDSCQHLTLEAAVVPLVLVERAAPRGYNGWLRAVVVGLLQHCAHAAVAEVGVQRELLREVHALQRYSGGTQLRLDVVERRALQRAEGPRGVLAEQLVEGLHDGAVVSHVAAVVVAKPHHTLEVLDAPWIGHGRNGLHLDLVRGHPILTDVVPQELNDVRSEDGLVWVST